MAVASILHIAGIKRRYTRRDADIRVRNEWTDGTSEQRLDKRCRIRGVLIICKSTDTCTRAHTRRERERERVRKREAQHVQEDRREARRRRGGRSCRQRQRRRRLRARAASSFGAACRVERRERKRIACEKARGNRGAPFGPPVSGPSAHPFTLFLFSPLARRSRRRLSVSLLLFSLSLSFKHYFIFSLSRASPLPALYLLISVWPPSLSVPLSRSCAIVHSSFRPDSHASARDSTLYRLAGLSLWPSFYLI